VTLHLGVLPTIAVGLVKMRRHSHFFRISYRGQDGAVQVAVFEVPKQMPRALEAIRARCAQKSVVLPAASPAHPM
jgi:hypothetical protein